MRLTSARGPYQLQAEIAACHARARMTAEETDWGRIVDAVHRACARDAVADCGVESRSRGEHGMQGRKRR